LAKTIFNPELMTRLSSLMALTLLLTFVQCAQAASPAVAVSDAWIREAPPGVRMMAGYLKLENTGESPLSLQGAATPLFKSAEIHMTRIEDGVARMRHIPNLALAVGEQVSLEPGGMHLMLMGPNRALKAGDCVEIELDFGNAGSISVQFPVRKPKG
jgi:copper(I)-binding protein